MNCSKINECEIKRSQSIKFFGISVDEQLSWTEYINAFESDFKKNVSIHTKTIHF